MPKTRVPAVCPCCPLTAASGRSDNIRRHIQLVHKVIPWDYVDSIGYKLNRINDTLGIKYHPILKKYGDWGFCFKCCTHVSCGMSNLSSKLATVNAHTCAQKQTRERKVGGVSSSTPKRAMTAIADDQFVKICKELKIECEFDDDMSVNIKKTLRALTVGVVSKDVWWEGMMKDKQLTHLNLKGKEAEAREVWQKEMTDWEDDHDSDDERDVPPVFEPRDILCSILANCGKEETKLTNLRADKANLQKELDDRADIIDKHASEMARLKAAYEQRILNMCDALNKQAAENDMLRKALSAAVPVAPPASAS